MEDEEFASIAPIYGLIFLFKWTQVTTRTTKRMLRHGMLARMHWSSNHLVHEASYDQHTASFSLAGVHAKIQIQRRKKRKTLCSKPPVKDHRPNELRLFTDRKWPLPTVPQRKPCSTTMYISPDRSFKMHAEHR
jgi:hypothetical protein